MRNVFTNSELPHVWAHKQQNSGRSTNMFFKNETIYSYGHHFAIAKHVTNEKGENAILFTTRNYSNTTVKHIYKTRAAIPDMDMILYCSRPNDGHPGNMAAFLDEIKEYLNSITPKTRKPELFIEPAKNVLNKAEKYASFFGIDFYLSDMRECIAVYDTEEYKKGKAIRDKKQAEKWERERLKREESERQYDEIKRGNLSKWYNLEYSGYIGFINGFNYLRINNGQIETTNGIKLPIDIAKRAFNTISEKLKTGGCNDCNFKILSFDVQEITSEHLKVGCHKIEITEINRIAKQLNWIN